MVSRQSPIARALAGLSLASGPPSEDLDLRRGVWARLGGRTGRSSDLCSKRRRDLVARLANEGFPRQGDLVAAGYLDELQADRLVMGTGT